jgi:Protein of unknown function DUF262
MVIARERETLVIEGLEDELVPSKYSITSYGADFSVASLVEQLEEGSIQISTFQRGFTWSPQQASHFIESLLLGFPVPGIFLAREQDSHKLLVIDGQQRLLTLRYFYKGKFEDSGKEFGLIGEGIHPDYKGRKYLSLSYNDRTRLDHAIIHATIVKQDDPAEDDSSIYAIFERINSGGTTLHPQEIRSTLYSGEFNNLLRELNKDQAWRSIYGLPDKGLKDQELILRFLALNFDLANYKSPMKGFLNSFMKKHSQISPEEAQKFKNAFISTVAVIQKSIGNSVFKRNKNALNVAVFDAVMLGVSRRLERGNITDLQTLARSYQALLENELFGKATETKSAISNEKNVFKRIELAIDAFKNVK